VGGCIVASIVSPGVVETKGVANFVGNDATFSFFVGGTWALHPPGDLDGIAEVNTVGTG